VGDTARRKRCLAGDLEPDGPCDFLEIEPCQIVRKATTQTKASSRVPRAGRSTRKARDPVVFRSLPPSIPPLGGYLQCPPVVKRTRSAVSPLARRCPRSAGPAALVTSPNACMAHGDRSGSFTAVSPSTEPPVSRANRFARRRVHRSAEGESPSRTRSAAARLSFVPFGSPSRAQPVTRGPDGARHLTASAVERLPTL
jgi:hypothetical protein